MATYANIITELRKQLDQQCGTIKFPEWVEGPTKCVMMTNSMIRSDGIHGVVRDKIQRPARPIQVY